MLTDALLLTGRSFVALGLIGLGLNHFLRRTFAAGRAPAWPAVLPGGEAVAYLAGAIVIAAGFAILARRHARLASLVVAVVIFFGALLRHIPVLLGESFLSGAWTAAGKALALIGGMLAIAATSPGPAAGQGRPRAWLDGRDGFMTAARVCLGVFLFVTGVQHFLFMPFIVSLFPPWFPGDLVFWSRFGGVALLAGGAGLLVPRTVPLAALLSGLMVFSWFWIIHVPRTFATVSDGIAVFEALAVSGIAFVIAADGYAARRKPVPAPAG